MNGKFVNAKIENLLFRFPFSTKNYGQSFDSKNKIDDEILIKITTWTIFRKSKLPWFYGK